MADPASPIENTLPPLPSASTSAPTITSSPTTTVGLPSNTTSTSTVSGTGTLAPTTVAREITDAVAAVAAAAAALLAISWAGPVAEPAAIAATVAVEDIGNGKSR